MTAANSDQYIATVNAGSSSIKLAVFALNEDVTKVAETTAPNSGPESVNGLGDWLTGQIGNGQVVAVGHRIVHGGPNYYQPVTATEDVLADLHKLAAFDPKHMPVELELVKVFADLLPHARQVLCFDTAFHHDLPTVSRLLPIPRQLEAKGVRRYGFHGLSYAFVLDELKRVEGDQAANGKVIIAHLGSGASLAALRGGQSIDTTMGLTPASGITMSTRSGDLDPGMALYLAQTEGYDAAKFNHMVNAESGLLGISETTPDMEKLLQIESDDPRAKDAVDIFCYQVKKTIGSYAAALGGLNTLVFTGGMGEAAPKIRARICDGLEFLGITLNPDRNAGSERLISADGSQVGVHVIHTDEAMTMARETARLIDIQ